MVAAIAQALEQFLEARLDSTIYEFNLSQRLLRFEDPGESLDAGILNALARRHKFLQLHLLAGA